MAATVRSVLEVFKKVIYYNWKWVRNFEHESSNICLFVNYFSYEAYFNFRLDYTLCAVTFLCLGLQMITSYAHKGITTLLINVCTLW